MKCRVCGARTVIRSVLKPSAASDAMNEQRRERRCPKGHRIETVEVARSDLQSLRVAAHIGVRGWR